VKILLHAAASKHLSIYPLRNEGDAGAFCLFFLHETTTYIFILHTYSATCGESNIKTNDLLLHGTLAS
jgi:hypothetical protein